MRQAHHGADLRTRRALLRTRVPLAAGVIAALTAVAGRADAQVGSANVPLPNVLLLLDTSGSFEHMIDGSNPEDTANNPGGVPPVYANCELAWNAGVAATPNRWGVMVQALSGNILNSAGVPYYSCVTMDRLTGLGSGNQGAAGLLASGNGVDLQYGIRDELGNYFTPYDSGYYLPFHRPVAMTSTGERCVYTPHVLPGTTAGGVGVSGGTPSAVDCPNEPSNFCLATDFPNDAIGTYLYDKYPTWDGSAPSPLPTPNFGYSSSSASCSFPQSSGGIINQAASLVRFGLMTFDNDPSQYIGVVPATPWSLAQAPISAFTGQWSYFPSWTTWLSGSPTTGSFIWAAPKGCGTPTPFELGARNPAAPPWEGRLIGFPSPDADVMSVANSNAQIQTAINAMRPYGATPTAALLMDAGYYFWGDPSGPYGTTPDPYVSGGCRNQYIILLTDGAPNLDMRPYCQGGVTPVRTTSPRRPLTSWRTSRQTRGTRARRCRPSTARS